MTLVLRWGGAGLEVCQPAAADAELQPSSFLRRLISPTRRRAPAHVICMPDWMDGAAVGAGEGWGRQEVASRSLQTEPVTCCGPHLSVDLQCLRSGPVHERHSLSPPPLLSTDCRSQLFCLV